MFIDSSVTEELQKRMKILGSELDLKDYPYVLYISDFDDHIKVRSVPYDFYEIDYHYSTGEVTSRVAMDIRGRKSCAKIIESILDYISFNKLVIDCIYYKNGSGKPKGEIGVLEDDIILLL